MPSRRWQSDRWRPDRRIVAAAHGLLAYGLGFATVRVLGGTGLLAALRGTTVAGDGERISLYASLVPDGGRLTAEQAAGWLFYAGQFVDPGVALALGLGDAWLFVVPPVALGLAGALTVRATDPGTAWEAAVGGAMVVFGYLPAMVLGNLVLLRVGAPGTPAVGPDLLRTLLVGVGYPYLWGGLGGVLVTELRSAAGWRASSSTRGNCRRSHR